MYMYIYEVEEVDERVVRLAPWARTMRLPQEAGLCCGTVVILRKAEFPWIIRRTWNIPPSSIISRPFPRILSDFNVFFHFHMCLQYFVTFP